MFILGECKISKNKGCETYSESTWLISIYSRSKLSKSRAKI